MTKQNTKRISVLLVNPGEAPRMVEIEDSLEAMQKIVGGYIEMYQPFRDEVALICNDEGKLNGLLPNRVIYSEPEETELSYAELKKRFCQAEKEGKHIVGYIVFSEDSFDKPYTEESRTYLVSSDNKAFQAGMGGYSIFGSCLDGTDCCLRLDGLISSEYGGKNGWKVERCYIKDETKKQAVDVIFGPFFVCYAPSDSEKFLSLPSDLAQKYAGMFKNPDGLAYIVNLVNRSKERQGDEHV